MRLEGQILGEDIGQLIMRIDVEYLSMVLFDEFANVMIPVIIRAFTQFTPVVRCTEILLISACTLGR